MAKRPTYEKLEQKVKESEEEAVERGRAEKTLRRNEIRYRTFFDGLSDAAFAIDQATGRILDANEAAVRIYGYSREEWLTMKNTDVSAEPEKTEKATRDVPDHIPVRYHRKKDGTVFPVETSSGTCESEGNTIIVCTTRDITDRHRGDEAVRRLAAVVRDSNDAVTVQDFEGNIIAWNRGAELMYGYSEVEALKMNIGEIVPEEERDEAIAFVKGISRGDTVESFETQRLTKDGRALDVWLTVTEIFDDKGRTVGVATTERDITERKRMEEKLRRTNEELKSFVDVVSHDLKNPIFAIQGFSALLLKKYQEKLDDKAREYLENIRTTASRMESLVSDLLALARTGQVVSIFGDIPSSAMVKKVTLNFEDRIKAKGVELIVADNLPEIYCDADRIHQVFENLLVNAIKFLGNNQPHKVEVGYKDMGAYYQFHVKDNGIGIDPKYHQKIFQRFKRLKEIEDDKGTGLGLTIVERIVNGHGGRVWVESEKGKGATFYFTLPKRSLQR